MKTFKKMVLEKADDFISTLELHRVLAPLPTILHN